MDLKPIIKFNGGVPIALCNRCFIMMCYVSCAEDDGEYCKVRESKFDLNGELCTSTKKGETPPVYCDKCKELLNYSLNE